MITEQTTFIVGAGGSQPYGLPVAAEISHQAKKLTHEDDIYQLLRAAVESSELLDRVLADLKHHPAESIDAFLEHRHHQTQTMWVGKTILAALLGVALVRRKEKPLIHVHRDWIECVLVAMSRGARRANDFASAAQKVTFVTFNFDSVIEEVSAKLIPKIYNGDQGIPDAIEAIKVQHLHGRLPTIPDEKLYMGKRTYIDGYTMSGVSGKWVTWTRAAANQIQVVLDDIDPDLLRSAQSVINDSTVLCFLGFNFDKSNLAKLGLPDSLKATRHKQMFGSALNLSGAHRAEITGRFGGQISLGNPTQTCLQLLDAFHVLRDS